MALERRAFAPTDQRKSIIYESVSQADHSAFNEWVIFFTQNKLPTVLLLEHCDVRISVTLDYRHEVIVVADISNDECLRAIREAALAGVGWRINIGHYGRRT
ncbi:MAG: hypothetical protein WDM79_16975 [Terricaulis sp.]